MTEVYGMKIYEYGTDRSCIEYTVWLDKAKAEAAIKKFNDEAHDVYAKLVIFKVEQ